LQFRKNKAIEQAIKETRRRDEALKQQISSVHWCCSYLNHSLAVGFFFLGPMAHVKVFFSVHKAHLDLVSVW